MIAFMGCVVLHQSGQCIQFFSRILIRGILCQWYLESRLYFYLTGKPWFLLYALSYLPSLSRLYELKFGLKIQDFFLYFISTVKVICPPFVRFVNINKKTSPRGQEIRCKRIHIIFRSYSLVRCHSPCDPLSRIFFHSFSCSRLRSVFVFGVSRSAPLIHLFRRLARSK